MPGTTGPLLPVREALERLQLIGPALVPFVSSPALAPAMGIAERYASIEAVALP